LTDAETFDQQACSANAISSFGICDGRRIRRFEYSRSRLFAAIEMIYVG
jgi:hypothetical protein